MKKYLVSGLLILSLFATSCKDSDKEPTQEPSLEPSTSPCEGDPIEFFFETEIERITGFLVVKFTDDSYKDYIPARNYSGTDNEGYYVPVSAWNTPLIPHFDKNLKYHDLGNGYYALDWTLIYGTGLYSYYKDWEQLFYYWTCAKDETKIEPIKQQIMNNRASDFVKDMRNMKLTKTKWSDMTFNSVFEKYVYNEVSDDIDNNITSPLFSYVQFVFVKDLMGDTEFPKEITQNLYEFGNYSAVVPLVNNHSAFFNVKNNTAEFELLRNRYENGEFSHDYYKIYDEMDKIQGLLLPILADIVSAQSEALPASLIQN